MLKLVRDHTEEGVKITGTPECPPRWLASPELECTRGRERCQVPDLGVRAPPARSPKLPPWRRRGVVPKAGRLAGGASRGNPRHTPPPRAMLGWGGRLEPGVPDGWEGPVRTVWPHHPALSRGPSGAPLGPKHLGRVGAAGPRRSLPPRAGHCPRSRGERRQTHKEQLSAPTCGVPLADSPPRAFKCAPTLALVHCHSHGNSYANSTHIRAHTRLYKHASTRAHTQTRSRVLSLTNMLVYTAVPSTCTRTSDCKHAYIAVQSQIH